MAAVLATTFEVGNTVGTPVSGYLIDKCFRGRKIRFVVWSSAVLGASLLVFVLFASTARPSAFR